MYYLGLRERESTAQKLVDEALTRWAKASLRAEEMKEKLSSLASNGRFSLPKCKFAHNYLKS